MSTVRVSIKSSAGKPLRNIEASTLIQRGNGFQREYLKTKRGDLPNFFFLTMPVGKHPLIVSADWHKDKALFVDFVVGVNPLVEIELEPIYQPNFPTFDELSVAIQGILAETADTLAADSEIYSADELWEDLADENKACALNLFAKMEQVRALKEPVLNSVLRVNKFQQDRLYLTLSKDISIAIRDDVRGGASQFKVASGSLHGRFSSISFKTKEETGRGNLQLSFDTGNPSNVQVDADIDLYTDVLRHLFGEVAGNSITQGKTNPFCVYDALLAQGIQPDYTFQRR